MSKARELLERVLAGMDRYGDIYPETLEEIREYLASEKQDQPEPVAWIRMDKNGKPSFLTLLHPKEYPEHEHSFIGLYLHPAPQRSFVRLSEEEISELWQWSKTVEAEKTAPTQIHAFARAIEDALEEKNSER